MSGEMMPAPGGNLKAGRGVSFLNIPPAKAQRALDALQIEAASRHGDAGGPALRGQHHDRPRPDGGRQPVAVRARPGRRYRQRRALRHLRHRRQGGLGHDLRERRGGAPRPGRRSGDHHQLRADDTSGSASAPAHDRSAQSRQPHPGRLAGRSGERPRDSVRIAVSAAQPTVVIVGAGFGGLRVARVLGRAPVNVVLLDRHNYHLFQPLLYQVATAGLEPEQIARPVRAIVRGQDNFEFRMVEVTGLDPAGKQVTTDNGPVAYDYLILAVGGETNYFGLEGIARRGFGLKDIPDALAIRNHVLRRFEYAMLEPDPERRRAELTFVVAGGGAGTALPHPCRWADIRRST